MFKAAKGLSYVKLLKELHRERLFDWYLEVGCRTGRIFGGARGKTIAVDPFFRATDDVIGVKPALFVFQQTSDDFFASKMLDTLGARLSFSFLDGMHLFEFLLRDIIGAEKASHPGGVIALHDCCPFNHAMTTRDLQNLPRGAWTGDVWKLIPILAEYRPDLKVTVLDAEPTGLVLLSNLDPASDVLERHQAEILQRFGDVTLEAYGLDRFNASFDYASTAEFIAHGYPLFRSVALPEAQALAPQRITP